MGFFGKVKQFLGIGGVKVELTVPAEIEKAAGNFDGSVTLTTKGELHVLEVTVKLVEEWTTGRGDEKTTKEFELGATTIASAFDIRPGEVKSFPFNLTFELLKSKNEELADQGGALGKLGKVAMFASGEKSVFKVKAEADVKGTALDPGDSKDVKLI